MKCILVYAEDISISEDTHYVQRTKIFEAESEKKICDQVRNFKTPIRSFDRLYAIDHEVRLPNFIF